MSQRRVLIVEDDRTVQAQLKAVFQKDGWQVTAALDAMQGLMLARQTKPDLLVLDIGLPAGGGASVFERLRQMVGTFQTPVLVYSAMPREEAMKEVPEGPDVAFVAKPAEPAVLLAAARGLVGG